MEGKDVVVMVRIGSGKIVVFLILMFEKFKIYIVKFGVRGFILFFIRELVL